MYRVLSIDAWGNKRDGYEWNNWFHVGDLDAIPETTRGLLKKLREEGFLTEKSKGKVTVTDDQYNLVVLDKNTHEPLFAVEYGNHF